MQLAKVIGTVVSNTKDERLNGIKLLVIQPVDSKGNNTGSPIVATDNIGAGAGETVVYAKSKEGAMPLPNPESPTDAGIIGIVDEVFRKEGT